jgi:ribosomal protein S18 acetylase RimI-like enzyme
MKSSTDDAVTVEPALVEDEGALLPLMIDFNREEGIAWKPEAMTAALRRLLVEHDLGLVVIARDGQAGSVVGYGIATFGYDLEFAGRDAFVTELFVTPAQRRRGLGRKLLASLVEALRTRDTRAVHLMVNPVNERARSLYAGAGFVVSPRIMMTREL